MSARPRLTFVAALATLLAALSLSSTFDDGNWFWPVVAAIAAGALGCGLGRRIGLPRPVVPLLGLAAVIVTVTWLNARDVAVLGLIPGPGALRVLDDLVRSGLEGMRKYATPAPTDPGLVLIAAAGAGLVAVVVDTLAVTYRSAAMAGVPLLLLYAVPLTVVRGGVPVLLFVAAAIGWLGLMLAEGRERLAGWGRALGRRSTKDDDPLTHTPPEPLGVVGRRIGAAAVGLALILPALMPWAGSSLFKSSGGGSGANGSGSGGTVSALNPVDELGGFLTRKSEVTLMKFTTDDTDPDYFRVITLDSFDGSKWKPAQQRAAGDARELPSTQAPDIAGRAVLTTVSILGLNQDWLPVTYPGGSIEGLTGRWAYDSTTLDVFRAGGNTTRGQTYTVQSRHLEPTAAELRAAGAAPDDIQRAYTHLPDNIPAPVLNLTNLITRGKTTAYDKAVALQAFFIDPINKFKYSTTPVFTGNPLVSFLKNREGFCQQFAGAFAVMARQAQLPTRIEIGFTPGSAPDRNGLRSVTNHNAHAWPEVYFAGIGWVRFEPTASAPAGVVQPAWAPGPNGVNPGQIDRNNNGSTPFDKRHEGLDRNSGGDVPNGPTQKTPTTTVEPATFPWALLLGGIAIVVMLLPAFARVLRRRRRLRPGQAVDVVTARETVRLAWLELADTARDLQDPWPVARTPRRTADWITASGVGEQVSAAAYRLARAVERSRYARTGVDVLSGSDPAADARVVAEAMEAQAPRRERWRARFIQVSVLAGFSERFAVVLDWTDDLGARLRDLVRRPFARRGAAAGG
ncbi:MAG: transglutaminaseTgpA domain-containing protein [Actinomycetes bacterium]